MIKKLIRLIFLLSIILVGILVYPNVKNYIQRWVLFSFCDKPITYTIGNVDPGFNLTSDQVKGLADKSAKIYSEILGRELFVYDPNSQLDINLVYDARQENIKKINNEREKVDNEKSKLDVRIDNYEDKKASLEKRLNDLNDEIENWNNKGGAPSGVYSELKDEQATIQKEINELNQMGDKLNNTTEDINSEITNINENVNKFNKLLNTTPEEGLFIGSSYSIEIYIYENDQNFVLTLAHEFGHALGLGHLENPDALMYKTSSLTTGVTQDDKYMLVNFCRQQNKIDLIKNDIKNIYLMFITHLSNVLPYSND